MKFHEVSLKFHVKFQVVKLPTPNSDKVLFGKKNPTNFNLVWRV